MQFPTLAILLISAGLAAAQDPIGNLHPDGKCLTKIANPVYLDTCHNLESNNSVKIYAPGSNCYLHKIAGCLDAGEPIKVAEGCHNVNEFSDAKAIRCRTL
ncbi:hypothetical protein PG996_004107 [Apiospora saccharicola]|uniref:Uncharacterized protein n=1 Tax=Apiospora saccharicola TaxID=335842 RepID=A0ABR1W3C3_9PEZI